jgi:hypothetical protein
MITDSVYNRVAANQKYWGGNTVIGVIKAPKQYVGYNTPQYNKAKNSESLEKKSCDKLKDCIKAAEASSKGTENEYNGFNQTPMAGRTKVCVHYFRKDTYRKKKG